MIILLTGAGGLIGQSAIHQLSPQHHLVCMVWPPSSMKPSPQCDIIEHDLTLQLDYLRLPNRIDAVIHLAQSRRFREFPEGAEDVFSVNTHATIQLAEYARKAGAKCFIFASTGGVYASSREKLREVDPVYPSNFYFSSKYASELLLSAFTPFFKVAVLRFFFVYGPQQRNMLIPNLFGKVLKSDQVLIEGKPGLHINPIYVEDAARVFSPILLNSFEGVLNVAGDEVVSMTDLVQLIAEVSGKRANISYKDAKYVGDLVADNNKMKEVLGIQPQVSLKQGLSELYNFVSSQP
jgi:nucleoside-diphosphate-sugar epimerase